MCTAAQFAYSESGSPVLAVVIRPGVAVVVAGVGAEVLARLAEVG